MDPAAVFAIIEKGLAILPIVMATGENVIDLINRMRPSQRLKRLGGRFRMTT
jgi:hypothetical protein